MMQQALQQSTTSDTLPPSAEISNCDQDCDEPATLAYRWEWGATGACCTRHAALLQQTSKSLKRSVVIHPIERAAPAPLLRDERMQLVAKSLVLEAELTEAQTRGLDVYRKNGDLQVQLNTAIVRERELKAQVADAQVKLSDLQARSDALNQENGQLLVELERLHDLELFVAQRDANSRGLEPDHKVDG